MFIPPKIYTKDKMSLTIIGDCHNKYAGYYSVVSKCGPSIQLGDMGLDYSYLNQYINPIKDKFFQGNHDHHSVLESNPPPHFVGRYGVYTHGGVEFFYIGGGYSIDLNFRVPYISWWPNEELSIVEMHDCLELYLKTKPRVVISHECPRSIIHNFTKYTDEQIVQQFRCKLPSRTSEFLQILFDEHKPEEWVLGHYHVSKSVVCDSTKFTCVGELDTYEIHAY